MDSVLPSALSPSSDQSASSDQHPLHQAQQTLPMHAHTTRPLYVLCVFSVLAVLSLLSLFAFLRLHMQRQRRIADSTPKLRYRRHHRLWILAAGANRRPTTETNEQQRGMVELETIVSSGGS